MTDSRQDLNDPSAIEEEVRRTQDAIGETVQKLEDKLNPREVARTVVGAQGTDLARELLDVVRQNPVPVALIAVGAIWLLATARSPVITRLTSGLGGGSSAGSPRAGLRPRSAEPAPIGPSPVVQTAAPRSGLVNAEALA